MGTFACDAGREDKKEETLEEKKSGEVAALTEAEQLERSISLAAAALMYNAAAAASHANTGLLMANSSVAIRIGSRTFEEKVDVVRSQLDLSKEDVIYIISNDSVACRIEEGHFVEDVQRFLVHFKIRMKQIKSGLRNAAKYVVQEN